MLDEPPRLFLPHFWANDDALKLTWDGLVPPVANAVAAKAKNTSIPAGGMG